MKSSNKSLFRRIFYSPVSIVLMIVVMVAIFNGAWGVHKKAQIAEDRYMRAERELSDIKQQRASLSSAIDSLSTPEGFQAELREKYHAVKEGESVALIIRDDATKTSATSSALVTEKHSFISFFLKMIGL